MATFRRFRYGLRLFEIEFNRLNNRLILDIRRPFQRLFCSLRDRSASRSSDTGFQAPFFTPLVGASPSHPVPVLAGPRWGAAERRADAAVVPLAIDRPPSSRRVVLQGGWASAGARVPAEILYSYFTPAWVSRYAQRLHRRHYRVGEEHGIKVSELVPERRRFLP